MAKRFYQLGSHAFSHPAFCYENFQFTLFFTAAARRVSGPSLLRLRDLGFTVLPDLWVWDPQAATCKREPRSSRQRFVEGG